jgi:hypothetical protein
MTGSRVVLMRSAKSRQNDFLLGRIRNDDKHDPNKFSQITGESRAFKSVCGIPPTEYRARTMQKQASVAAA